MKNPFLKSLKPIWKNPQYVFIDEKKIKQVARRISKENLSAPGWREPVFPEDDLEFAKLIVPATAINFCFTNFETGKKFFINYQGELQRGSLAMIACLKRALDEGKELLNPWYLATLSFEEMQEIFRYDPKRGETPIPLLYERYLILREIGHKTIKYFQQDFLNIYKKSKSGSRYLRAFGNQGLVKLLITFFESFKDESYHQPSRTRLQFHKRAQLLAMIYQGRALSSDGRLPLIKDADDLGPPADYVVPMILEELGILEYEKSLKEKIRKGIIISPDSEEEQEIRAQTIQAMVKLTKEVNKLRQDKVNIIHTDYRMWKMRREIKKPHHLTPTIAY